MFYNRTQTWNSQDDQGNPIQAIIEKVLYEIPEHCIVGLVTVYKSCA